MGRTGYVILSLLAALALAAPPVLYALDTAPGEQALGRGFLALAVALGCSWLPLWPAAAVTRSWGYWAGLPVGLLGAAAYAAGTTFLAPVTALQAALTWLALWWPALPGPGHGGRLLGWLLLLAAGGMAWWRAPAGWAELWPWVLAFNALLTLLYTPLPAKKPAGFEPGSPDFRLRG